MYELIIHFFPSDPLSENISCLPESVLISPFFRFFKCLFKSLLHIIAIRAHVQDYNIALCKNTSEIIKINVYAAFTEPWA